ncbi:hypothetical protein BC833DRAFT_604251 [Globomyces pollinis-pini]|nr:hypothetical protein BC833DRAFT_604251 [Globomyces pollinis-pini]
MSNSVDDILQNVPPTITGTPISRNSYIIIGKPGCGKTTLAAKLAALTKSKLINIETELRDISTLSDSPVNIELTNQLVIGGVIPIDPLVTMMESKSGTNAAQFKGYILDGIPLPSKGELSTIQMNFLNSLIKDNIKSNCVLVDLRMSDEDLIHRRASLWTDPVTNISYPGQQILYSRQRRNEGWVDGDEDTVFAAEQLEKTQELTDSGAPTNDDGPVLDEEAKDEDEEETEESKPQKLVTTPYIKNRRAYPILSEKVLDRLIKLPENFPENVAKDLELYDGFRNQLESFKKNRFSTLRVIDLDGTQHPDVLFEQLKVRMISRGFSVHAPLVEPIKLASTDGGFKGIAEADVFKYYISLNTQENEPVRQLSTFKRFCPVTFSLHNQLMETNMEIAATYRGLIYFFNTEEYRTEFLEYPDKYLTVPFKVPNTIKIFVLGPPHSGKTTVAKCLASRYQLSYVNVHDILSSWGDLDCTNIEDEALKASLEEAAIALRSGDTFPNAKYADIVKHTLDHFTGGTGWVLDGFPETVDQAVSLKEIGIIPDYIYSIQSDVLSNDVYGRLQLQSAIPLKGIDEKTSTHVSLPYLDRIHMQSQSDILDIHRIYHDCIVRTNIIRWRPSYFTIFNNILATLDPFVPQAMSFDPKSSQEGLPELMGVTKDYCPVTLKNTQRLTKGDTGIAAKFMNEIYFFYSEDEKSKFLVNPLPYVKNVKIPPPRLMILGPSGSGKTTIMKIISQKWKLPSLSFDDFCRTHLKRFGDDFTTSVILALEENSGFPIDMLTQILVEMYQSEPFCSTGFILEGFPNNKADLDTIIKLGFLPDAFIFLKVDSEIAAKRKLKFRREELERAAAIRKAEAETAIADLPEDSTGDQTPPQADAEGESLDPYTLSDEQIMEELLTKAEQEIMQMNDYQSALESAGGISVYSIATSRCMRPVTAEIDSILSTYLKYRPSLFSNVIKITQKQAARLLNLGIKRYSIIGKYCPVTLKQTGSVSLRSHGTIPIINGDEIYFLQGKAKEQLYLKSVKDFVFTRPPSPMLSPTCCIVGNPKSGKTTLGQSIMEEMDAVNLTVSSIIQSVLSGNEVSRLCRVIKEHLQKGQELPDELVVEAVVLMTSRVIASGKGWILDGYPTTLKQAMLLEKAGFQPHVFIEITIDEETVRQRAKEDMLKEIRLCTPDLHLNVPELNMKRNYTYENNIEAIRHFFGSKYSNWERLDGTSSKWSLKQDAQTLTQAASGRRQRYLSLKSQGYAAPIYGVGLSNAYQSKHMSRFGRYCPYSLVALKELHISSEDNQYMAEYNGQFYSLVDEKALNAFLEDPNLYANAQLPAQLPKRKTKDEVKALFPKQLDLKGYCPVTFAEGPEGFKSIIPGSQDCIVEYGTQLFAIANEDQLAKFMKTPWKYCNLTLPTKLPPPTVSIPLTGLPIVGYLEQAVAGSLTKALLEVGNFKPKYPYKTITESASEFLALHLKANNPKSKDWIRKSYQKRLSNYQDNCDLMKVIADKLSSTRSEIVIDSQIENQVNKFLLLNPQTQGE